MEKVLINLFIPSLEKKYDVYIPTFLPVEKVCQLLAKLLADMTKGQYVASGQELLISIDQSLLFQERNTLSDYGIRNGEHLMLC